MSRPVTCIVRMSPMASHPQPFIIEVLSYPLIRIEKPNDKVKVAATNYTIEHNPVFFPATLSYRAIPRERRKLLPKSKTTVLQEFKEQNRFNFLSCFCTSATVVNSGNFWHKLPKRSLEFVAALVSWVAGIFCVRPLFFVAVVGIFARRPPLSCGSGAYVAVASHFGWMFVSLSCSLYNFLTSLVSRRDERIKT